MHNQADKHVTTNWGAGQDGWWYEVKIDGKLTYSGRGFTTPTACQNALDRDRRMAIEVVQVALDNQERRTWRSPTVAIVARDERCAAALAPFIEVRCNTPEGTSFITMKYGQVGDSGMYVDGVVFVDPTISRSEIEWARSSIIPRMVRGAWIAHIGGECPWRPSTDLLKPA